MTMIEVRPALLLEVLPGPDLSVGEERFLRFMDCFRNEVAAEQVRQDQIPARDLCIANGYLSFDGSKYSTTKLGRQKLSHIPVLPIIDLAAMKEYERWNGRDHSLDFRTRHDIARQWVLQRDDRYDQKNWTEVEQ